MRLPLTLSITPEARHQLEWLEEHEDRKMSRIVMRLVKVEYERAVKEKQTRRETVPA